MTWTIWNQLLQWHPIHTRYTIYTITIWSYGPDFFKQSIPDEGELTYKDRLHIVHLQTSHSRLNFIKQVGKASNVMFPVESVFACG